MSLQSDWLKGILFQSQLLYSKTINRGPHNSEKRQKNCKQEARETLWYKRHLILYKATSLRIQVQEQSISRPPNSRTSSKPLSSNKSQDQDKVQVQVNRRFKNKL